LQTAAAHVLQLEVSLTPTVQTSWLQLVPLHDWPQTLATSETHVEFQPVLQQYESALQMDVTHGSQPDANLLPAVQGSWAQEPTASALAGWRSPSSAGAHPAVRTRA
jgi:hypothetical protein